MLKAEMVLKTVAEKVILRVVLKDVWRGFGPAVLTEMNLAVVLDSLMVDAMDKQWAID